MFLGGVNHIIYHGTAYSPADAAWPGWLFYASTELNPQNPLWRDFAALNEYVTRCQSVLQSTQPDNDILLYWPIHDYWQNPRGLRKDICRFTTAATGSTAREFGRTAKWLDEHGYTFDYISDRQLAKCTRRGRPDRNVGQVALCDACSSRARSTCRSQRSKALVKLAEEGATIAFLGSLPTGPPGLVSSR